MKKKIVVIALAAFALLGTAVYLHGAHAGHSIFDEGKSFTGMRCTICNGTGFNGQFNCAYCRGTGRSIGY